MKVLILAYDFPPLISIGGLRPYSWYKYLPVFGVKTTVVTRHWTGGYSRWQDYIMPSAKQETEVEPGKENTIIRVPFKPGLREKILMRYQQEKYSWLRKLVTYFYGYLELWGMNFDARINLFETARREISAGGYDYIIATGKPFILFKYASRLAAEFNIPWIADYRDSWTLNHVQGNYSVGPAGLIFNRFCQRMEKKFLRNARLITTAAPSYAAMMPPYFPRKNIKIIYNGYDDEIIEPLQALLPAPDKFIVAYAGTIYPMQRLEVFLEGFRLFIADTGLKPGQAEVDFWGVKEDESAVARINSFAGNLTAYMQIHNKVEYKEVMKNLCRAHVLLLLASGSDDWLNAKLFDYLALRRRILMAGNKNNVMSRIIGENEAGVSAEDAAGVADYLKNCYKMFLAGQSMIISAHNYSQFSRRNQAYVFSQLLKEK